MKITEEECIKCGLCCWFDPETMTGKKELIIKPDGFCIHRNGNGCKIYEDRPQTCKDFERGGAMCLELRRKLRNKILKQAENE